MPEESLKNWALGGIVLFMLTTLIALIKLAAKKNAPSKAVKDALEAYKYKAATLDSPKPSDSELRVKEGAIRLYRRNPDSDDSTDG